MGKIANAFKNGGQAAVDFARGPYGIGAAGKAFLFALDQIDKRGLTVGNGIVAAAALSLALVGGVASLIVGLGGAAVREAANLAGANATTDPSPAAAAPPPSKATSPSQASVKEPAPEQAKGVRLAANAKSDAELKALNDEYSKYIAGKCKTAIDKGQTNEEAQYKERLRNSQGSGGKPGVMTFDSKEDAAKVVGEIAKKGGAPMTFSEVGPDGKPTGGFIFADGKGNAAACSCHGPEGLAIGKALQENAALIKDNPALQEQILSQIKAFNATTSQTAADKEAFKAAVFKAIVSREVQTAASTVDAKVAATTSSIAPAAPAPGAASAPSVRKAETPLATPTDTSAAASTDSAPSAFGNRQASTTTPSATSNVSIENDSTTPPDCPPELSQDQATASDAALSSELSMDELREQSDKVPDIIALAAMPNTQTPARETRIPAGSEDDEDNARIPPPLPEELPDDAAARPK